MKEAPALKLKHIDLLRRISDKAPKALCGRHCVLTNRCRQNKFYTLVASQLTYDSMDQMHDSKYPTASSDYSLSNTLCSVGIILFIGSAMNYFATGNGEDSMIITAYSFFFFLGSGLIEICASDSV